MFTVDVSSFAVNIPDKSELNNDQTKVNKLSGKMTITDKIFHFATMAQEQDEAREADAIMYTGGQVATAIKFTDPGQVESMGVAKVWNESGIDLYFLSTPRHPRLKLKNKWAYDGLRNQGGLFKKPLEFITEDTTIETDIYQMLRLVAKGNPKKWPDGLIINASGLIQGFNYKK